MIDENGFIFIWRKIRYNAVYRAERFSKGQAMIDLFLRAMHSPQYTIVGDYGIDVARGSFLVSQRDLQRDWKWSSVSQVNSFLKFLEKSEHVIKTKIEHKKTLITVIKYDLYQRKKKNLEQ